MNWARNCQAQKLFLETAVTLNIKLVFLLFLLEFSIFPMVLNAQTTFQFGALPALNINRKLKNDWSLNAKIESRQLFLRGEVNGISENKYNYVLTDYSLITAKKVGLNSRIAAGYLIRIEGEEIFHRFIQQFIVVQKFSGFRLAHRFLSDQTYSALEAPDFRLRYRITTELPLNGESVDPGEFYLKVNNEYVNSLQGGEYDLEIRIVPLLGYDLSSNFKLESGLDYRINSFLNQSTRHSYWLSLNLFLEI
jgi:hypothetical protein